MLAISSPALAKHAHKANRAASGGWDGTWSGAWGGSDPTAITVSGNRVVSYQYGGATTPVASSKVTPKKIVYGESDIVVTVTRTGPNSAHATIHSSRGDGTAELTRS